MGRALVHAGRSNTVPPIMLNPLRSVLLAASYDLSGLTLPRVVMMNDPFHADCNRE